MNKWNMIIDVARCHDCNNCFLADKDEFVGNDFPPYSLAQPWSGHRWMNIERKERGQYPIVQAVYLPTPCLHHDDAPCIKDSPPGTVYKRDEPIKWKCRNCGYVHEGTEAPAVCPACRHVQAYYEPWAENY